MGFFDGLRRDKKQAEPVQQEQRVEADTVEDEIAIEHIEVVERAPHETPSVEEEPIEERPVIEPTLSARIATRSPLRMWLARRRLWPSSTKKAASANLPRLSTFLRLWESLASRFCWSTLTSGQFFQRSWHREKPSEQLHLRCAAQRRAYRGSRHSRCVRGLGLVPATINLAGAEVELVAEMARENRLKDAVGSLRGKYDYVFIDCRLRWVC